MRLDSELVDHLAVVDSARYLYEQRLRPSILLDSEAEAKNVLLFQINHIDAHGVPASAEVLAHQFEIDFEEPRSEVSWLVGQLRERYQRNEAARVIEQAAKTVMTDPQGAVEWASARFNEIRDLTRPRETSFATCDWEDVLGAYQQRIGESGIRGAPIGFEEIDAFTGGLRKGRLYVNVARPKQNKSFLIVKSAIAAQLEGWTPCIYTLEMSRQEMYERYMCMASGISYSRWEYGLADRKDFDAIERAFVRLSDYPPVHIIEQPFDLRTVPDLRDAALDVGADVVYIDQLSFIRPRERSKDHHLEIQSIIMDLKEATKEFPIWLAHHFNRTAASMTEMADLDSIGLSDSVGKFADTIFGIHQTKEMRKSHQFEFGIVASRSTDYQTWTMLSDLGINTNFRCIGVKER